MASVHLAVTKAKCKQTMERGMTRQGMACSGSPSRGKGGMYVS